jgi:fumarylpyruvate hydrolase
MITWLKWAVSPAANRPSFSRNRRMPLLLDGNFPYPPATRDVHHEVELVVALQSGGKDIAVSNAAQHIYGYAVGIDMTRRDLQGEAKKAGRPWEVGKAFDHSAPIGEIISKADAGVLEHAAISLHVNGNQRQSSDISQMIWSVPEIISELSRLFELHAGDIIFTGTPSGVGPVQPGDKLHAVIESVGEFSLQVYMPS